MEAFSQEELGIRIPKRAGRVPISGVVVSVHDVEPFREGPMVMMRSTDFLMVGIWREALLGRNGIAHDFLFRLVSGTEGEHPVPRTPTASGSAILTRFITRSARMDDKVKV
jgi:hypothetical protein